MFRLTLVISAGLLCAAITAQDRVHISNAHESGWINDGYKVGVWDYFDAGGELVLKVDYEAFNVLYQKEMPISCYTEQDGRWKPIHPDQAPTFVGSPIEIDNIITSTLHYPGQARYAHVSGEVIVSLEIDAQGRAVNYAIVQDIGYGAGKSLLYALKSIPDLWLPAKENGRYVHSKLFVAVLFTLEDLPPFVSPENTAPSSAGMGTLNQLPTLNFFRRYTVNQTPIDQNSRSKT